MIVKTQKEILIILANAGYKYNDKRFDHKYAMTFNCEMFMSCGKTPATAFTWLPEWLEENPKDCEGRICEVWDSEQQEIYKKVEKYLPDSVHPFRTKASAWKHARPLTPRRSNCKGRTMKDTGGSAYPWEESYYNGSDYPEKIFHEGKTLRDDFAGQALTGITSDPEYKPNEYAKTVAQFCYKIADAMIKERNK